MALALVAVACLSPASPSSSNPPVPKPTVLSGPEATSTSHPDGYASSACPRPPTPGDGAAARTWTDVTGELGLVDPLTGMFVHAAAWGDVDGDGRPDLFVGTFADRAPERYRVRGAAGPAPDRLLLARDGSFIPVEFPVEFGDVPGRTSGAVFADVDADGDADLVLSRNAGLRNQQDGGLRFFENREGRLVAGPVIDLPGFQGRTVGVFDADRNGLLDVVVAEDRFGDTGTRLFLNRGGWSFTDATEASGIGRVFGLGLTTVDLSGDGVADLFVAGDNRLFLGVGDGTFRAVDSSVFAWERFGSEDLVGGAATGDVDGNGLPDLVVGHHFNSTIDRGRRVPVRLYLNRGEGRFVDVTDQAGLVGLPTKAPHVEVADLDNDGIFDILTSASAGDGPAVLWGTGVVDGIPRFLEAEGLGDPHYWVAAPTVDVDGDGALDVFLAEFEPSLPSRLLLGGGGGHWVEVSVAGPGQGIGTVVEARSLDGALLARTEITVTAGYSSGRMPVVHLGLGDLDRVRLTLRLPDGTEAEVGEVEADRHVRWPSCG